MEVKQEFTDYLMERQKQYKKEQLHKQRDLEYQLNNYALNGKNNCRPKPRKRA